MLVAIVSFINIAAAVLCLIAIPVWGLGVPGNPDADTPWVQGWKMGFYTLLGYPLAVLIIYNLSWDSVDPATPAALALLIALGLMLRARWLIWRQ